MPFVPVLHLTFLFSECAVMLYSVDQSPDDAAEIIACVTDVDTEIAIPSVHHRHSLYILASLSEMWDPCHCFRADPNLADQP